MGECRENTVLSSTYRLQTPRGLRRTRGRDQTVAKCLSAVIIFLKHGNSVDGSYHLHFLCKSLSHKHRHESWKVERRPGERTPPTCATTTLSRHNVRVRRRVRHGQHWKRGRGLYNLLVVITCSFKTNPVNLFLSPKKKQKTVMETDDLKKKTAAGLKVAHF